MAIGKAEGKAEGEAIGQARGETRLGNLISRLIQDQRNEEILLASTDSKRREQLYKEYNILGYSPPGHAEDCFAGAKGA